MKPQLEDIYEAQIYSKKKDPRAILQESLMRIRQAIGAIDMAFIGAFMAYDTLVKQDSYYENDVEKLTAFKEELQQLEEKFEANFIQNPHQNHPNPETRKDLV